MIRTALVVSVSLVLSSGLVAQQSRYQTADGELRIALAQQPLGPNGPSKGPDTMANGDPPMSVMGGVRLTDPLEQRLPDDSRIEQLTVDDLRYGSRAVYQQLVRLNRISDKLYIHIDMDVLDPREVMAHGNKVPNGPSSEQLGRLFEEIFTRYPKASAIGFATIPPTDEGGPCEACARGNSPSYT